MKHDAVGATYYKIKHKGTQEELYAKCDLPVKAEKLCEILGLDEFTAEIISKEEYDRETDDEEGDVE